MLARYGPGYNGWLSYSSVASLFELIFQTGLTMDYKMKRRKRELLIKPVQPETPEERWKKIEPTLQMELSDIIACVGLPISKQAQNMEDGDRDGHFMRLGCSDDENADGAEEKLTRKKEKKKRYYSFTARKK